MPRRIETMKDVAKLRYSAVRCKQPIDPQVSEWGNPAS